MTEEAVSMDELIAAREALIVSVVGDMPDGQQQCLDGLERGEPDSLLAIAAAALVRRLEEVSVGNRA
jgi:hypothetical protein